MMQVSCLPQSSMPDRPKSYCDKRIGKVDIQAPSWRPASVIRNFRGAPNISWAEDCAACTLGKPTFIAKWRFSPKDITWQDNQ